MFVSIFATLAFLWFSVQALPGLLESVAYVFGMLLASFTLETCFRRDAD